MVKPLGVLVAGVLSASAFAVMAATPAQADEEAYLGQLQPKYVFLSKEQLLDVGNRVCQATGNGMNSSDVVNLVYKEVGTSMAAASDIVSAAIIELGC